MLVITRRPSEKFFIGDNIEVVLISVDRNKVRLGIVAPAEIPICRDDAVEKRGETVRTVYGDVEIGEAADGKQ